MKKQVDFTEGNIVWAIVRFSIPLILGELLQNLYNSVDALVAGNLVDQNALAAVTVCGVIANLVVNFFNAMSIGSNVVVAKANGSGERERLCHTIRVTFSFGVVLGVLLSLFGILLSPQLLRLAGAQESYWAAALTYLRIYLAGLMFTVIYNNAAGILRALGRADIPFRILVVSCGMNIALDLLFVSAFDMGIAGVGVATVLSQAVSVAMAYRTISREIQSRCLDLREMYRGGRPRDRRGPAHRHGRGRAERADQFFEHFCRALHELVQRGCSRRDRHRAAARPLRGPARQVVRHHDDHVFGTKSGRRKVPAH